MFMVAFFIAPLIAGGISLFVGGDIGDALLFALASEGVVGMAAFTMSLADVAASYRYDDDPMTLDADVLVAGIAMIASAIVGLVGSWITFGARDISLLYCVASAGVAFVVIVVLYAADDAMRARRARRRNSRF